MSDFPEQIPVRSEFLTQWREEYFVNPHCGVCFSPRNNAPHKFRNSSADPRNAREKVALRRDRMIRASVVCVRKKKEKHMIQNTRGIPRPFFGPVAALNLCHG
jgi:hypothetical protein